MSAQYSKTKLEPGKIFPSLGNTTMEEDVDENPEKAFDQMKTLLNSVGGAFQ